MTTDFPTAPPAYGLEGPSAGSTVEKSQPASHTEFLTLPSVFPDRVVMSEYLDEIAWETEAWVADAPRLTLINSRFPVSLAGDSANVN